MNEMKAIDCPFADTGCGLEEFCVQFAGVPLHIIQRGNNRIVCFFAEQDYRFYLYHLEELAQRFECGVHA